MDITSNDPKEKKPEQLNIYQYDAQLALAFQADCEDLLQKFSNLGSFSFTAFSELWRETCFITVFEGQDFILMLQTFLENCFFVVKKFLFLNDVYSQVGALYLLYALYYKQPIREWVKIRLTQTEADKLNDIIAVQKQNKSWEVVFIYCKMRLDGAFQYCALVQPLGLDAKFLKRYDLASEGIHKKTTRDCPVQKFKTFMENDPILTQLQETDKEYQSLVNKYKEKCNQLFVFPSAIGDELKKTYDNLFDVNTEELPNEQGKLKEIKTRAMASTNAVYRAERSMVTGTDYDGFEADAIASSSKQVH
ncbi:SNAPc SNAP43 domain containing protein [Asbolus verrucosus]|uniref:SNAPc SNAP43 domain containing protein n=1 Tax=Asbolus verrucosus TaxID=1661398 RepID=A0A482V7D2_ASBVE|nr:SNAPc SNAP43 domain containing protein [Asbolus verrucosus]